MYVQGFGDSAGSGSGGGGGLGSWFSGALSSAWDSTKSFVEENPGIGDTLGGILKDGISRAADAELTKRFGPTNQEQFYQGEDGSIGRAGSRTVVAPPVTVTGRPANNMLLYAALGAVVLLIVLRR